MTLSANIHNLLDRIDSDAAFSEDAIYMHLTRLLAAPAPNSGAALSGAVGAVIRELTTELGLSLSEDPRIRPTGNLAIEIGAAADAPDLLITAHMDRPTFRVLNLAEGTLYPLCAIRVPGDEYACGGIAVGYHDGRVQMTARGQLRFQEIADGQRISFQATDGALNWGDSVLMSAQPRLHDGRVIATGLDNAAGALIGLLSANALSALSDEFAARGRKIIFAFTDQEEGPPVGLFGQGAARLLRALPPPRLGFINIDGHNVDEAQGHVPGVGASHAFVSGFGARLRCAVGVSGAGDGTSGARESRPPRHGAHELQLRLAQRRHAAQHGIALPGLDRPDARQRAYGRGDYRAGGSGGGGALGERLCLSDSGLASIIVWSDCEVYKFHNFSPAIFSSNCRQANPTWANRN